MVAPGASLAGGVVARVADRGAAEGAEGDRGADRGSPAGGAAAADRRALALVPRADPSRVGRLLAQEEQEAGKVGPTCGGRKGGSRSLRFPQPRSCP